MSLRPRYSLLTLLVLTALVAGGVKLWYGPHWRTLSDPLTASEQSLLDQHPFIPNFRLSFPSVTNCLYRNTVQGPELLRIQGQPAPGVTLYVVKWYPFQEKWTDPDQQLQVNLDIKSLSILPSTKLMSGQPHPRESVRCWFWSRQPQQTPNDRKMSEELKKPFGLSRLHPACFFISDRRQLYQYDAHNTLTISLERVQVDDVADTEVRTLIEQELAQIPDQQ